MKKVYPKVIYQALKNIRTKDIIKNFTSQLVFFFQNKKLNDAFVFKPNKFGIILLKK